MRAKRKAHGKLAQVARDLSELCPSLRLRVSSDRGSDVRHARPILDARKRRIRTHLEQCAADHRPDTEVAVLLSGGADSTVVALAAPPTGHRTST